MKNSLLSTLEAASHGARLAGVEVVPNFPAPFSNVIVEKMAANNCKVIDSESQTSAINAAIGAELCEKRTFLPLSIPKCIDEFYSASFLRLPIVAANVSRSVFSYSTKSDHNSIMGLRDAGWMILMPSGAEEVIYSILQAYAIAEDKKVLLPAVVNIDMPTLRETMQIPSDQFARKFIPKLKLPHKIDIKKPSVIAPVDDYPGFVIQQQRAMANAAMLFSKMEEKYGKKLKKPFGMIEKYKLDDAELVIICAGFHAGTAKSAIDKLREQGKKVGLLRLRVIRPWPKSEIKASLTNAKRIAVVDHAISLGHSGILYTELSSAIRNKFASNFISLGKHFSESDFFKIVEKLEKSESEERVWM